MQEYAVLLGRLAGVAAFISFIPYIHSILKGETKPERATFAIWSFVNVVTTLSYFASGARETIWMVLVFCILQIVVFVLSFKYGVGGFNKLDVACLSGAAIGIILWVITKNPFTALYISIFVEILGWIPTYKKVYIYPYTENLLSWSIGLLAATLNLFAITEFKAEIISYPLYLFLGDGAIVLILLLRRKKIPKGKEQVHSVDLG